MKYFFDELRRFIGMEVLQLAVTILPNPEKTELAQAILPALVIWRNKAIALCKEKKV